LDGLTSAGRTERMLVLNSQWICQLTEALGKRNRLKEKRMIERVLHPHNMQRALKQVIANKGSAGVDRMSVMELTEHIRQSKTTLYSSIRGMEYLPQPILGVEPRNRAHEYLKKTNKT
jgi:hypothetical protein